MEEERGTRNGRGEEEEDVPEPPPVPHQEEEEAVDDDEGEGENGRGLDLIGGEGEDDPSEDEDPEEGPRGTYANSLRKAAELLENLDGDAIEDLCVSLRGWRDVQENSGTASFRRLVSALGRPEGGGRAVRQIHFSNVYWDRYRDEDMSRLFGEVLPAHSTLEVIGLGGHEIPQSYVRLLVSSLRGGCGTPLRKLELNCAIDHDSVKAVADMILRNLPLPELSVDPLQGPRLAPGDSKRLCQAVVRNTNLRKLILRLGAAAGDALDGVIAAGPNGSPLRTLVVIADDWSDECVASVARQLRTNTALERLEWYDREYSERPSPFFRPIMEVLQTYNVTLRRVTSQLGPPLPGELFRQPEERAVAALLRRNRRFRRAIGRHLEPRGYHVSPAGLLPRALGTVSAVPTLVYRLLRKGDLIALADHLLQSHVRLRPGRRQ